MTDTPTVSGRPRTVEFTGRDIAIIGAALRRCIGWDDPQQLQRFVNVAADHVREGWSASEMDDVLEKVAWYWETHRSHD